MFFPTDACQEAPEEQSFQKSVAKDAKSACRTSALALLAWLSVELIYKAATQCSFEQFLPGLLGINLVVLGPLILSVLAKKMRKPDENQNAAFSSAWGEVGHQQAALAAAWCITGCFLRSQWGLRGQIISYEDRAWPDLYNNTLWELAFCGTQIAISLLRFPYRTAHFVLLFHLVLDVAMWLKGALCQEAADHNVIISKSMEALFAPIWATLLRLLAHSIITALCLHQVHSSENLAREAHKMSSALEHQQQVESKLVEVVDRLLCETFGCVAYVDASSTLNVLRVNAALEQLLGDNVVGQPLLCRAHGVQESWRLVSYMRSIIDRAISINREVPFMHEAATMKFIFQHSSGQSIHALTLAVYMPGSVKAGREACVMMGFRRLPSHDATSVCDAGFAELEPLVQPQPAVAPPSMAGQVQSKPPISGVAPTAAAKRPESPQMSVVAPDESAVSDLEAARTTAVAPSVVAAATDNVAGAVAGLAIVTGAGEDAERTASVAPSAVVAATDKVSVSMDFAKSGIVAAAHEVTAATVTVVPSALAAATDEVATRTIAVSQSAVAAKTANNAAFVAPSGASTLSDEVAARTAEAASLAKTAATDTVAASMVVAAPSGLAASAGEVAAAMVTVAPSAVIAGTGEPAARTAAVAPAAVCTPAGEVAAAKCTVAFSADAAATEDEIAARTAAVAPSTVVAAADGVAAAAPAIEAIPPMTLPGECHAPAAAPRAPAATAAAAATAATAVAAASAAATANFDLEAYRGSPGSEMEVPQFAEAQRFNIDHGQAQPAAPYTMVGVSIDFPQVCAVQTTPESSQLVEEMRVHQHLAEEVAASALRSPDVDSMPGLVKISLEETLNVKPKSTGSIGHPNNCELPCKFVWTIKGCKDGEQCLRCHSCSWKKARPTNQPPQGRRNQRGASMEVPAQLPKPAFMVKTGDGTRKQHGKQSRKSAASPDLQQGEFISQLDMQLNAQFGAQFAQESRFNELLPQTQFGSFVPVCLSEEGSVDFGFAPYDAPNLQANWSISSSSQDGSAKELTQTPQQQGFHADDGQSPRRRNVGPMTLIPSRPNEAPGVKSAPLDRDNRDDDPCFIESSIMREVKVRNCFLHVDGLPSESAFRRDDWPPGARSEPIAGKWAGVGPIRRSF